MTSPGLAGAAVSSGDGVAGTAGVAGPLGAGVAGVAGGSAVSCAKAATGSPASIVPVRSVAARRAEPGPAGMAQVARAEEGRVIEVLPSRHVLRPIGRSTGPRQRF